MVASSVIDEMKAKNIKQNIGSHINKMPSDASREDWQNFYRGMKYRELSVYDLITSIYRGYGYSSYYRNRRIIENFVSTSLVSIDFDKGDTSCSIEFLKEDSIYGKYGTFMYSTPSHTEDKPKTRMVFVLEEPCTNADEYHLFYVNFTGSYYPQADQKVYDAARIFYGSKRCNLHLNGRFMTQNVYKSLLERYKELEKQKMIKEQENLANIRNSPKNVSAYLAKVMDNEYVKVAHTCTGGRHNNLYTSTAKLANYISAGMSESEIENRMYTAAVVNGLLAEDGKYSVKNTIKMAMAKGKTTPKYIG